jgi:hypothetical protein
MASRFITRSRLDISGTTPLGAQTRSGLYILAATQQSDSHTNQDCIMISIGQPKPGENAIKVSQVGIVTLTLYRMPRTERSENEILTIPGREDRIPCCLAARDSYSNSFVGFSAPRLQLGVRVLFF